MGLMVRQTDTQAKASGQRVPFPGLQATVDALQQEQENLEGQLRDAHRKLAEANTELRTVRQEFKHQLEEQQAQFRAVEEETYNEREQQVGLPVDGGGAVCNAACTAAGGP